MGRGRQKAKQTKVARKLKYYSPETDYEALQRELQAKQRDHAEDDNGDDYEDWRNHIPSATDDKRAGRNGGNDRDRHGKSEVGVCGTGRCIETFVRAAGRYPSDGRCRCNGGD